MKIRKTRLEELVQQGNRRAKLALKVVSSLDTYLSATQLGITLCSLALGWLGESAVASLISPLIGRYISQSQIVTHTISFAMSFLLITFMHIVLGELVPRSVALQRVETLALFSVWPLFVFYKIGYPIIALFNRTARAILGIMGINPVSEAEAAHTEEELRMIVSASQRGGFLDQMESKLIDNVFDFADRLAREIMVPRQDMVCLFADESFEENMKIVKESGHTRYPLCVEDKDHVIGMIHIHEIMDMNLNNENTDLRKVMREILVVPEGMPVAKLLQVMQRKRTHLAIVADEYGGTAGLVAMEDIVEEIVGDIHDEYDEEELEIQRVADGIYEFDGLVLLDDVAELLNIDLAEHEEDTIGGYIFGILGRRPEVKDQIQLGNYLFSVLKVNGFRVVRVKAERLETEEAGEMDI